NALQLRIYGDEFYARRETSDGYTVIYDTERRCYCYASLAVGRFVSTGIPVHKAAPRGLRRHLKEDSEVRNERFGLSYARIRPTEHDTGPVMMRTLGSDGGLLDGRKLHRGQVQGLTVIVDFDDIRTSIATADVEEMFNSDNYTENGNHCSVKSYFETVSSGKLTYTNLVIGPVRLSKRRSHYINNLLVEEVMDIVVNDLNVDLSQFDSKNDGIVDAINLLYAGESQYDGVLWPHNSVKALRYGNVRTHYYQLTGLGLRKVDLRIGTICHENGHLLCRFPDMYDYGRRDGDHEKSQGIGRYCLMGSGNHLHQRRTPSPICGYLRELAGWVDNVFDLNSSGAYTAEHGTYNSVMKFSTDKANEYFIIENRTQLGLDSHLPSGGLAVLHCDTLGSNEWQEGTRNKHYQCALVQADGHLDLENNRNAGDEGDLYKAKSEVVLSHATTPSSREWDGTDSGLQIRDVTAPGQAISFSVGTAPPPNTVHEETSPNLMIPDNKPTGISSVLVVSANGEVTSISIGIEIIHSWISDLKVSLRSPSGMSVVLHDHEGQDGDDIIRTWTSDEFADLQRLHGEEVRGDWTLHIVDKASDDVGRLLRWHLDMEVTVQNSGVIEDQDEPRVAIPDANALGISSTLSQSQAGEVKDIVVTVDIEHTYIGDLQV
ncbi:MAG: M6 family metalloprotease domain-containing protein, partial [Gammaproteobacteria bacterium]|nr:M6 family metalloprotease domain-containing protein [Gammaproteobacteria bacterium]